ncbi:MAG: hypothetical protein LBB86_01190 [Oscillospiraceae bacterium]|nr:hypothetical protein [Oscillospiraceae bacterium]
MNTIKDLFKTALTRLSTLVRDEEYLVAEDIINDLYEGVVREIRGGHVQ